MTNGETWHHILNLYYLVKKEKAKEYRATEYTHTFHTFLVTLTPNKNIFCVFSYLIRILATIFRPQRKYWH